MQPDWSVLLRVQKSISTSCVRALCIGYHMSGEVISVLSLKCDIIIVTSERGERGTIMILS